MHNASECSCQFHFSAFDAITSQRLVAQINQQASAVNKKLASCTLALRAAQVGDAQAVSSSQDYKTARKSYMYSAHDDQPALVF